jgi:hypothetical protein
MDIIQLFGTSGVPAIVAGSVFFVFELGERFASQRAKDALSKWLLTFDVQKAKALPDGTQQLFERIFGERHFSRKCFARSAAFSLGATCFIGILLFLIAPAEVKRDAFLLSYDRSPLVPLVFWLTWSIVIDYVSLFKTRLILRTFVRMRRINAAAAVPIMVIDYVIYVVIFSIGVVLLTLGMMAADRIARGGSGGSVLAGWFPFIVLRLAVGHFFSSHLWATYIRSSFGRVLCLRFGCGST